MSRIHLIVTSGGTREPIDDVRYIGNVSTGRLGARIAAFAAARGHRVTLIHAGGSALPGGWDAEANRQWPRVKGFVTAADLRVVLKEEIARALEPCAVVMAAAVADYRPERLPGKIPSRAEKLVVPLRKVPKIVDRIKAWKPDALLVKFKLESGRSREELLAIGRESAARSAADLMLVNDVVAMSGGQHPAILFRPGSEDVRDLQGKEAIAGAIVSALEELVMEKAGER
jgi:phosphopantothenate---cysteine ligase (CTP)